MSAIPARYELVEEVNYGGWGFVWRAKRLKDGFFCALKRILPIHRGNVEMEQRFHQEARLLHVVKGHPNVLRMIDFHGNARDGSGPMLATEFLKESLETRLKRGMAFNEKIKAVRNIFAGLQHVHKKGIVHRDIKPSNIMVDNAGVYKIIDFGCAKAPGYGIDLTRFSLGTEVYMAPEQGKPHFHADERSDIHALGVLIFRVFIGRLPEFNTEHKLLQWPQWESADRRFIDYIIHMTELRPGRRYQNISEALRGFEGLVQLGAIPRSSQEKSDVDWGKIILVSALVLAGLGLVAAIASGK